MVEIDPSKLHPLSPEVISKQATINIGMKQQLIDEINLLMWKVEEGSFAFL